MYCVVEDGRAEIATKGFDSVGRLEEAEDSVGKFKMLCVQDVEVISLMEQLDVWG